MTDLVRRPAGTVRTRRRHSDLPIRRAAVVCRPDRTVRIVAIGAALGSSVAGMHLSSWAPWSWPLPLAGLAVAAVINRSTR
jgi:hypothetical protein